jgi:hypothetical protein
MKISRKTYPQLLPKLYFWVGLIVLLALLPAIRAHYGDTTSTALLYVVLLAVIVRMGFLIYSRATSKKRKKDIHLG